MWTKRTFLAALGSLPFLTVLKPVKADTIIHNTYRGNTYTPEFAKDLMAVYGLNVEHQMENAIDWIMDRGKVKIVYVWTTNKQFNMIRRKAKIVDGKLSVEFNRNFE